jgi:hypothetical protein
VTLALAAARAQEEGLAWERTEAGHWLRVAIVGGSADEAVAVLWPHPRRGDADEQRALAAALAGRRAAAADAVLPAGTTTGVEVADTHTLFVVVLSPATRGAAAAWFSALAAPAAGDVDAAARSLARAALAADDALWLHPGDILLGRARCALAAGTPGGCTTGGSPRFLQGLSPADFAAQPSRPLPEPMRVAVVGAGTGVDALRAAMASVAVRPQPAPAQPAGAVPAASARMRGKDEPCTPHPRVDAPYVAAAVRAPVPSPASVPFALGVEVLRARAEARFRSYRGNEPMARAPFVGYRFLLGEPVVLFCRRGPVASAAAMPRAELEALLSAVRQQPPSRTEVASAASLLLSEWAVPPWTPAREAVLRQMPYGLGPRARTLCLLGHWGVDDATVHSLPATDAGAVAACLGEALRPEGLWWGGLVPTTAPPLSGR